MPSLRKPRCVLAICLAISLPAQVTWSSLTERFGHATASDFGRATVVVFGGESTPGVRVRDIWEYRDSTGWEQKFPSSAPPAVSQHAMSFWTNGQNDGHVLLFGGVEVGGRTRTTWTWTGDRWILIPPQLTPPARDSHAMAFDAGRRRVVLFGGTSGLPMSDTWEWDGSAWQQQTPAQSPPARFGHAMAYDPNSGTTLIFGGNPFNNQTWEYIPAQSTWTQRITSAGNTPPGRIRAGMAYDATWGKIVLFGGEDASGPLNDTWLWDPTIPGWVAQNSPSSPPRRSGHRLEYDSSPSRQAVVLLGGKLANGNPAADLWTWNGTEWREDTKPPARNISPIAYDRVRREVLMFGGNLGVGVQAALGDTWLMRGGVWRQANVSPSPRARHSHDIVYMPTRNRSILYGGEDPSGGGNRLGDTWEWDGAAWRQLGIGGPQPRRGHRMVLDSRRNRLILFGGETCGAQCYANDTWEFDGTSWSFISTGSAPPPQAWGHMVFDEARGRAVLLSSGINVSQWQMWEYDPASTSGLWVQVSQPTHPPFNGGQFAYDSHRQRSVWFDSFGATWEWDGTTWSQRLPRASPPGRVWGGFVFDATARQLVLFGGGPGWNPQFNDTWFFHTEHFPLAEAYGAGCSGTGGSPLLLPSGNSQPWLGETFLVGGTQLAPNRASFLFVGVDANQWNGIPLNHPIGFPLTNLGMTGCVLLAGGDIMLPVPHTASGTGDAGLPLPNNLDLLGRQIYMQLFCFDTPANAFGATTSNGLACRLGAK